MASRRVKRAGRRRRPPKGWDELEPTLEELDRKMAEVEVAESKSGDDRVMWPIFRLHHQRSRFVYEMFYVKKRISRQLYEYCLREKIADAALIAKWKKEGYERLCCLRCVQSNETSHGTVCICRIPRKDLEPGKTVECIKCGCHGCASCD